MPFTSWSIHREDVLLFRALGDIGHEDGFYIDVGANSPAEDSFTRLFYDHGWHGLNVEPSRHWYDRLVVERPRDINIHAACSDKPGRLTLFDDPGGGLGTVSEVFADRHAIEGRVAKQVAEVDAVTLASLCERYAPPTIHFLKIDVEGHEEQVLRGMDFARFRPWILCVEATEPLRLDVLTHAGWDPLVQAAGYRFAQFDRLNRWYVAEEHPERMAAFAYPVDDYLHWTVRRQIEQPSRREANGVDRDFVATCYEVLLGRELEDERVAADRRHLAPLDLVATVIRSPEFRDAIYLPMARDGQLPSDRFPSRPSVRQRFWGSDRLPISAQTSVMVGKAKTWVDLLRALLADEPFVALAGLPPLRQTEPARSSRQTSVLCQGSGQDVSV